MWYQRLSLVIVSASFPDAQESTFNDVPFGINPGLEQDGGGLEKCVGPLGLLSGHVQLLVTTVQ
jgi:hypothetical protein